MVSFYFGWRHVVGLWKRCMTWRWLISLNSLYSALLHIYIYICILCILFLGSLWSAVNRWLSWLVPVVHNVTDVLTGWLTITGSGLKPFVLLYCVPLWCFISLVGFMCMDVLYSLLLYFSTSTSRVFCFIFFNFLAGYSWIHESLFLLSPDQQLVSWEMAKIDPLFVLPIKIPTIHAASAGKCWHSTSLRIPSAPTVLRQDCVVCLAW